MKLPVAPLAWPELFNRYGEQVGAILSNQLGAEVRGKYEHWAQRHRVLRREYLAQRQDQVALSVFPALLPE